MLFVGSAQYAAAKLKFQHSIGHSDIAIIAKELLNLFNLILQHGAS